MKKNITILCLLVYSLVTTAQPTLPKDKVMDKFITALMKKMTLEEKLGQLNLLTPGGGILTGSVVSTDVENKIRSGKVGGMFGIIGHEKIHQAQALNMKESRLKIPLLFGSDVIHGYKTTFPIPLGLACTWDMELIERSAQLAAKEAAADGLAWTFSPMVDIARDPRWGRIAEGAGEDPYLGSEVARAMVKGYQGKDLKDPNTIMACVKHFALYGAPEGGRDYHTVDMSRVRMYNEYFPPYKAAIDAGCASVMSSFNEIDGIPATGNRWLLTDVLRTQWGFQGMVVSDYTSVNEMIDHGMGDLEKCSQLALHAGLDMDMVGEGFLTTLTKSLKDKKVTQKEIDQACRRILEAKYRLGLFEDPYRYGKKEIAMREVNSAEQRKAAREFGRKSMVLLKNEKQTLPLRKSGNLALVGPLANNKSNMLGTWSVSGDAETAIPILQGMQNVGGDAMTIRYAKGANITDDSIFAMKANVFGMKADMGPLSPQAMLDEAVALAKTSDVIVAVVGEASEWAGEASSRTDLTLPASQKKLLAALAGLGKPLVIVNMSGRPMALVEESQQATALIQMWNAGSEAGNALADVLFGAHNPSAKLTTSFPVNVGQVPIYYSAKNTGRPLTTPEWGKFRSAYLDAPNTPLYPFGYGLSYTQFSYTDLKLSKNTLTGMGDAITATITVKNTGKYDGEEVVQLYLRDMVGSITRPLKELKGFQKIMLKKGESKEVQFTITEKDLRFYNSDLKWVSEPGEFKVFIGGNSVDVREAVFRL